MRGVWGGPDLNLHKKDGDQHRCSHVEVKGISSTPVLNLPASTLKNFKYITGKTIISKTDKFNTGVELIGLKSEKNNELAPESQKLSSTPVLNLPGSTLKNELAPEIKVSSNEKS